MNDVTIGMSKRGYVNIWEFYGEKEACLRCSQREIAALNLTDDQLATCYDIDGTLTLTYFDKEEELGSEGVSESSSP